MISGRVCTVTKKPKDTDGGGGEDQQLGKAVEPIVGQQPPDTIRLTVEGDLAKIDKSGLARAAFKWITYFSGLERASLAGRVNAIGAVAFTVLLIILAWNDELTGWVVPTAIIMCFLLVVACVAYLHFKDNHTKQAMPPAE